MLATFVGIAAGVAALAELLYLAARALIG